MYFYDSDPDDTTSPPSSLTAIGLYSDTGSYFAGLFNQSHMREDHWRVRMGLVNGRINNELDVDNIGRVHFASDIYGVGVRSEWRVVGDFFLGVKGAYSDMSYSEGNEASEIYFEAFDVQDEASASFGLLASYDSRDNIRYPHSGMLASMGLTFFPEELGAETSYEVFEADANAYLGLLEKHVLALRGYGRLVPSDTPYAGLSTLGQRSDLRGYTPGEHMAENLLSAQAEYRWAFARKWGAVVFGGVAVLYDGSVADIDTDNIFLSRGVGIRYALHAENKVNFRVDFAWGEDDQDGVYVSVSEAF
jgi:outer membrane protein assembly factor BamA